MISDEQFFAWLDGELEPAEAAAIDEMVAADPTLQRRVEGTARSAGCFDDAQARCRTGCSTLPPARGWVTTRRSCPRLRVGRLAGRRRPRHQLCRTMMIPACGADRWRATVAGWWLRASQAGADNAAGQRAFGQRHANRPHLPRCGRQPLPQLLRRRRQRPRLQRTGRLAHPWAVPGRRRPRVGVSHGGWPGPAARRIDRLDHRR